MADGIIETTSPWERSWMAADRVRERCRRAAHALDAAGVPYAVVGGNAVADWVARIDEGAIRNTKDVDILVRRSDLANVSQALESAGFVYHHMLDIDMFLDGPNGKPSEAVHLLYAGETVRPEHEIPSPEIAESERGVEFQVANLEALVRMKLVSNRRKDQVHLIDMLHVGLIDQSWPARFPPVLAERLQILLDDPNERLH